MSATAKFYSAFFLAVVIVIAISFYAGYRIGSNGHVDRHAAVVHPRASP